MCYVRRNKKSIRQDRTLQPVICKNVLCFEDVVLLTGLSKSHLYKLTSSHQIPHYKPNGKQVYFDRAEVESWMKHNRVATKEEIDQAATNYIVTGRIKKGGAL